MAAGTKTKPRKPRSTRERSHGSARGPQDAGVKRRRRPRRSAARDQVPCPELVLILRKYWDAAKPSSRDYALYHLGALARLSDQTGPTIQAAITTLWETMMSLAMSPTAIIQTLLAYEARYDLHTLQRVGRDLRAQWDCFADADRAAAAATNSKE